MLATTLLERDTYVNCLSIEEGDNSTFPVWFAAATAELPIVELLLQHGADRYLHESRRLYTALYLPNLATNNKNLTWYFLNVPSINYCASQ